MTIIPFGGMCCINVGKLPHAPAGGSAERH